MIKRGSALFFSLFLACALRAQKIEMLSLANPASLRGLCAVNDRVVWVSGSAGTVGISTDAGINWKWITVPGYEKTEAIVGKSLPVKPNPYLNPAKLFLPQAAQILNGCPLISMPMFPEEKNPNCILMIRGNFPSSFLMETNQAAPTRSPSIP